MKKIVVLLVLVVVFMLIVIIMNFLQSPPYVTAIITSLIAFLTALFVEPIKRFLLRPKMNVEFKKDTTCICKTTTANGSTSVYIRVRVNNASTVIAQKCKAYLVSVERGVDSDFAPTFYCESMPLAWSCQSPGKEYDSLDIPKGVNQYIDLIETNSNFGQQIIPKIMVIPFRYIDLFKDKGKYRFTVLLTGENVEPVYIKVVFDWQGVWDQFTAIEG